MNAASDRVSRRDVFVAGVLASMTLLVGLYFAPRGFQSGFVDMAQDGYQLRLALDLSQGKRVFRDTFDQYGPLNGYLNVIGFIGLGRSLLAIKYAICGWYALTAVALFVLARHWLSAALAGFSTLVWLCLAPFYQHGIMISPHVYVLFLQAVATIVALRARRLEFGPWCVVGVLAGLSWSAKQSLGVLFFIALNIYLLIRCFDGRGMLRLSAKAAAAVASGFVGVIAAIFAILWMQGALHDWYLQTVAFPRDFYIQNYAEHMGWAPGLRSLMAVAVAFVKLQVGEAPYWIVIRVTVCAIAIGHVIFKKDAGDFLLMACISLLLWLGAFPSSSFMHQWWTASLAIPPFVAGVQEIAATLLQRRAVLSATVATVAMIVGSGVVDRGRATRIRAASLTETMTEPPIFRGIRTDIATKRAIAAFYELASRYRVIHPGTNVVSVDASDGVWTGVAESLLFLSFFEDNAHSHPVYWSLPVLSTVTYPAYNDSLSADMRTTHPLIVDSRFGAYAPIRLSGYALLAVAQSDYGYWYMYAPADTDGAKRPHSIFVASDGATESGFVERGSVPKLADRLRLGVDGAWRGLAPVPVQPRHSITLAADAAFTLYDPALAAITAPVNVYTWPSNLRQADLRGPIELLPNDPWFRADIVRDLERGTWTVDGTAEGPYSYLVRFRERDVQKGSYLVVRGELREGGFQVGLIGQNAWAAYANVTAGGMFEAVLQMQAPGRYGVTFANDLDQSWFSHGWRYSLVRRLGLWRPAARNRFTITQAGWIQATSSPS